MPPRSSELVLLSFPRDGPARALRNSDSAAAVSWARRPPSRSQDDAGCFDECQPLPSDSATREAAADPLDGRGGETPVPMCSVHSSTAQDKTNEPSQVTCWAQGSVASKGARKGCLGREAPEDDSGGVQGSHCLDLVLSG